MAGTPQVAIVVPVFNGARYIAETLESIVSQSIPDWRCVVVDDGSADNSGEIVQKFIRRDSRFSMIRQCNAGISVARNAGMKQCDARIPYVSFMDGDDVWEPQALERLIAATEASPELLGAHGVGDYIDEHSAPLQPGEFAQFCRQRIGFDGRRVVDWAPSQPTSFNVLLLKSVFPPGLLLFRRAPVEAVGGFDPKVGRFQDWEFLTRLTLHGDLAFLDDLVIRYRRHVSNLSNDQSGNRKAYCGMRARLHFRDYQRPEQRRLARAVYRPLQLRRLHDQAADLAHDLRAGRLAAVPRALVHMAGVSWRFLRGYPVAEGFLAG